MSVTDDLKTVADDLTTLQGVVASAVTELGAAPVPSAGDTVLATLVTALEAAGYTVTAPEVETAAETALETTEEAPAA